MKTTNFFQDIFNLFSNIKIKKENREFYKIDQLVYYLADIQKSSICAKDVYEIDIRSAFPTICQHLFSEEKEFLEEIHKLKNDKLARNIFIATTLKGTDGLKQLGYISKMIISSTLMDADPDAKILELKKDGITYLGKSILKGKLFKKYSDLGFNIRQTKYKIYLRYQKTSHYLDELDNLIIKGIFKDRPRFLVDTAKSLLIGEEIDFDMLNKVYSNKYFEIVRYNLLDQLFTKYYLCEGHKYLDQKFRYHKLSSIKCIADLLPKNYLKLFLYPILVEKELC